MSIKEKKEKEVNKWIGVILSIAIPILVLTAVYLKDGLLFESNDDFFIARLLSGALTGAPTIHALHVRVWITAPLCFLYRMNAQLPWWGLFLLGMFVLSHAVILYYGMKNKPERLFIVPVAELAITFSYLTMVGRIQYTSIAILTAVAGYACLILEREKKSAGIWFFVLEFLSFGLRDNAMLLIQPFGLLVLIGIGSAEKEKVKTGFLKTVIAVVFIIALGLLGRAVTGEFTEEWKNIYTFHNMRMEAYDYGQIPSYGDVKEVLTEYGVSEEEWETFADYYLQEWSMNPELNKALKSEIRNIRKTPSVTELLKELYDGTVADPKAWPVVLMFLFAVGFMVLSMKFRYTRALIGFLIAHFIDWGYIFYRGRVMDRVAIPLLTAECLFLLFVILSMVEIGKVFEKKKILKIFVIYAALAGLVVLSFFRGRDRHREMADDKMTQKILAESFREIENYCNERPNEAFILDINSLTSVQGGVLDAGPNLPVNYKYNGGWFSVMPEYKQGMSEYLGKENGFSYIVYDFGDAWDRMECGTAKNFKRICGSEPVLKDRIRVSSGGEFLVYRFDYQD